MADPAAAVADTHALIFLASGGAKLGERTRSHFRRTDAGHAITYVPVVVLWEVCLLVRVGRVKLNRPVQIFADDLFSNPAYQSLDMSSAQVLDANGLTFTNGPFDALIVAAARSLSLPLMTRDITITRSGLVETMW